MTATDKANSCSLHPLIGHLSKMIDKYATVNFNKLCEIYTNYRSHERISRKKVKMFMACLFHFNLSVANVYQCVGNNYTASYRDVMKSIEGCKV